MDDLDFTIYLDGWLDEALPPTVNYPVCLEPCEGGDWEMI